VKITDEDFINMCVSSHSMRQTSIELHIPFNSFKRKAINLGCYNPNQGGKNTHKPSKKKYKMDDIFSNIKPMQSHKLKQRLLKEGYKEHICENCGLSKWLHSPIPLELHHIDGNKKNNEFNNLMLLCPNCHSLTETYRGKNIKKKEKL